MVEVRRNTIVVAVMLFCQLFQYCHITHATKYMVGDDKGWTSLVRMDTWPQGKKFYAGDILVFEYERVDLFNVVVVDKRGYDTCTETKGARVYRSGHEEFKLAAGETYFICSANNFCPGGTKLAINATARS